MKNNQSKKQPNEDQQAELQLLANNYEKLQEKIIEVTNDLKDLNQLNEKLENFSTINQGDEILVPLGSNIFSKATLKSNELIVNIGTNVLVNKTVDEVKEVIDKQISTISEFLMSLEKNSSEIGSKLLQAQLQK